MHIDQHSKIIAPSLLAANFANLENDIRSVEQAGAVMLHLDVMDGHFVPNISFGAPVIRSVKKCTSLILDTHLMIENPDLYLEDFQKAGSTFLTVHVEACKHLHSTITRIRELGMRPGVSLNPATPVSAIYEILPLVDLVLVMSVNPGFGGQKFILSSVDKIIRIAEHIRSQKLTALIEVDGGIDATNISSVTQAGANIVVAGNAIFNSNNSRETFLQLSKQIIQNEK